MNVISTWHFDSFLCDVNSILFENSIIIEEDVTIKAIGFKTGYTSSPVSAINYTIVYDTVDVPTISVESGEFTSAITVELSTDSLNTDIYYSFGDADNDNNNSIILLD